MSAIERSALAARVTDYASKLCFPADARADLLHALDRIAANGTEFARFSALIAAYAAEERDWHFTPVLEACREICACCGVHEYTGTLLLYLSLSDGLRAHYRANGIDEQIFWASLADLRYKLEECRLVKGINGSFAARWHAGIFKLQTLALGRLQFERTRLAASYPYSGGVLPAGSKALSVHIPRTGTRLAHTEVQAAYRLARDFFRAEFQGGPVLFTCASWLLYPWNMTVLPEGSNLRAFCADYEIVAEVESTDYTDLWRLFDCAYTGDPDALPQDTSLRRAYAARVKRGEPLGTARGIFLMD